MEKRKETLEAICERIKALENEVCALRVQNKRMRVVIAALVVIAVLPYLLAAGMQTQTFRVLRVERLEFVKDGELMAAIAGAKTGFLYGLRIYDKVSKPMVEIFSLTSGSFAGLRLFNLLDKYGKTAIGITTAPNGNNSIVVFNSKGRIVTSLGTVGGTNPAADRDSGHLTIMDGAGRMKMNFFVIPKGDGMIGVTSRDGESGVFIGGGDTGGRIEIGRSRRLGNTKKLAVTISVAPDGSGVIVTTDSSGSIIWSSPLR